MSDHYWKVTTDNNLPDNYLFMSCPQCGEFDMIEDFHEGVCIDCYKANQGALDLHNAQYDYWQGLSDKEREDQIRWSSNHYG